MNVLIVDSDKNFSRHLTRILKENSIPNYVDYNVNYSPTLTKLIENSTNYDIQILDLDSIKDSELSINSSSNYIVYSSNSKKIKKYINNPSIQRVFQKPINLNIFSKYLSNYCGIGKKEANKDNNIIQELLKIGFSLSNKGTAYLAESINLALSGYSKMPKILFNQIGNKYNISGKNILWSINNSINRMIQTTNPKIYNDYFKIYDNRKPTPKFIIEFFLTAQ